MRRAHAVVTSSLLVRRTAAIAASGHVATPGAALYGTAAIAPAGIPERRGWWRSFSSPSPSGPLRSVSTGIVGAFSFSMTLTTAAEAKELPPQGLIPKDVVLYQYEACPFCNKVKAFLDFHHIPYKVVEVNPLSKKEIKWSDYKKVPILVVDGEQLVESSDIITNLNHRLHPEDTVIDEEETKWLKWVDDHLVHVLSPNIYRTISEALESFDYISKHGNFTAMERISVKYAGAAIMYMVFKKLKKRHNIADERVALYEAARTWTAALDGKDFLGGLKPNLADLAVFGILRPIRYLKAGKDMIENTDIGGWYQRMDAAIGESARIAA